LIIGAWLSLVERTVRDREVGGSNPLAPTSLEENSLLDRRLFLFTVIRFRWDPAKAASNLQKHDVSFEEAASVFGDPLSETFDDPDHSLDEYRFIIIGRSRNGKLLFVSHLDEGDEIRIISARPLTNSEVRRYEQGFDQ
jgi:uncharacterized DUF497 family protein